MGHGIDDFPAARDAAYGRRRSASPTILFCGRLVPMKGVAELTSALALVLARRPRARARVVGRRDGDRGLAPGLDDLPPSLESRLEVTGWTASRQALDRCYREADLLVVPSHYESFGLVALEGMLHGLPIVATAVEGLQELLEHRRTALLVPPRDADALADALLELIDNPALAKHLGRAAADEARRRWSWRRVEAATRAVYRELVAAA